MGFNPAANSEGENWDISVFYDIPITSKEIGFLALGDTIVKVDRGLVLKLNGEDTFPILPSDISKKEKYKLVGKNERLGTKIEEAEEYYKNL